MVIHVPAASNVNPTKPDGNSPIENTNKININKATIDELDSLPGIGYIIAQRIIDYRAEYGPFESIEDIVRVSGIKESVYAQIKEYICI
jgi:competence protein ComEA